MTTNYDPVNIRGGFYLLVLLLLSIVLSLSFKGPIKSLFVSFSFFSGVAIIMYLIDLNYMMKLNKEGKINKYKFQSCPEGYKKHILNGNGPPTAENPDGNNLPNNSKIVSCLKKDLDSSELPDNPSYYSNKYDELFILGFHGEEKIGTDNKNPCKAVGVNGELKNGNCFNEPTLMKEKCERINSFHTNTTDADLKKAINSNWSEYNTYCKL